MSPYDPSNSPVEFDFGTTTIADIGEIELIERLKVFCAPDAIGDDAATLAIATDHKVVVTTDMLMENVHFSGQTTPPYSVGWRAATANLADLTAMGAILKGIVVSLGLPRQTPLHWVEAVYRGMSDCLSPYGGAILGGDLCRAEQRSLSITAIGQVRCGQAICRDTATPGMTVVTTGTHGASRAGLALLLKELELTEENSTDRLLSQSKDWIKKHQLPLPRFGAMAALRQLIELEEYDSYPTICGMDSSDGLANALLQISNSSSIGMNIFQPLIPLPPGLSAAVSDDTAFNWALYGGEDFKLVLCLPTKLAEEFTKTPFATDIGMTTDTGLVKLFPAEDSYTNTVLSHDSFKHF